MDANELLIDCSPEQRRWVAARLLSKSDAEAARTVGVHPTTVCRWANKQQLDDAVAVLLADPIQRAQAIIADALPKAAQVKVRGLDSRNEGVRQAAASDVLDRGLGKAMQRAEVEHSGSVIVVDWDSATNPSND